MIIGGVIFAVSQYINLLNNIKEAFFNILGLVSRGIYVNWIGDFGQH